MKLEVYDRDAILIPGGGVRENAVLPIWTQRRLDRAIALGNCQYFIPLSAGTTHKPPPLDTRGFPIFESVAAANYLVRQGVAPQKIRYETASYDTVGNAYFAKTIHIDPLNLSRLLVITSEFHMARTKAIFEWLYSPKFSDRAYELAFESVSDREIEKGIIAERQARESSSLDRFLQTSQQITNLSELHEWLFTRHKAYSVAADRDAIAGKVLDTY